MITEPRQEPNFAIGLKGTGHGLDPLRDILFVHGDGSEIKIPGRYVPIW